MLGGTSRSGRPPGREPALDVAALRVDDVSPTERAGVVDPRVPALSTGTRFIVLGALLLALSVRLPFFVGSDFPLNDGGLFFVMSQEVVAAHYALPTWTSYNADNIPFTYPPLAFFVTAIVSQVLSIPLLVVVRYLPLVANVLAIVAFIALARALLRTRYHVLFAAAALVLLPRSYEWLVMGGGLTRSLGFLLALTALSQGVILYRRPAIRRLVAVSVLVALTWLTHLEMGLFATYSFVLLFLFCGRSRQGLRASVGLALGVLTLTAPWWLTVVHQHGLAPYLAAGGTAGWSVVGQPLGMLPDFLFPGPPFLTLLGGLAILGIATCLLRRELLLPLWLIAVFLLTPRSAATEACVPLALLVSIGLVDVVFRGLQACAPGLAGIQATFARASAIRPIAGLAPSAVLSGLTLTGVVIWLTLTRWAPEDIGAYTLEALPAPEREAMTWVADHTPVGSVFLVLSPKLSWETDYVSEWFPALARRKSVLTPQGAEWLPEWAHARRACLYNLFRQRALGDLDTMEGWLEQMHVPYTHVYVSRLTQGPLELAELHAALVRSPRYQVLLDGPGGTILARRSVPTATAAAAVEPPVARDCQALFDQPQPVLAAYWSVYGDQAPWAWQAAHTRELDRRY